MSHLSLEVQKYYAECAPYYDAVYSKPERKDDIADTVSVEFLLADSYEVPEEIGVFDGAFAGLWFSHVPVQACGEFFDSLHARLKHRARVVFLDNSEVQCDEMPIVDRNAEGNTYQLRDLRDGFQHRILKNLPTKSELVELLSKRGFLIEYRELDNFLLLEYETDFAL